MRSARSARLSRSSPAAGSQSRFFQSKPLYNFVYGRSLKKKKKEEEESRGYLVQDVDLLAPHHERVQDLVQAVDDEDLLLLVQVCALVLLRVRALGVSRGFLSKLRYAFELEYAF
jgi:hypothetical protein